jgi:hypothetical protein
VLKKTELLNAPSPSKITKESSLISRKPKLTAEWYDLWQERRSLLIRKNESA